MNYSPLREVQGSDPWAGKEFAVKVIVNRMRKPERVSCTGFIAWMVALLALAGGAVQAITPEEVFQDGRRAFDLGHWQEAREHFSHFNHAWPTHTLGPRALLMETLADIRSGKNLAEKAEAERLAEWSARYRVLREKFDAPELSELALVIQGREDAPLAASASALLDFPPDRLAHLLDRGLVKPPAVDPMETLRWIHGWRQKFDRRCPAELRGRLALWRSKALWEIWLSPLPSRSLAAQLQKIAGWPVEKALQRSLREAFQEGDPAVKRESALLGLSVEAFAGVRLPVDPSSDWMTYLNSRGIHEQEAWCPR
ncbi:MAG: hypothetical protein GX442_13595 [Candidatus Riflebacteria bacterium]|nr:hypothetical protein [Candidatus Riflebacteria bacterium]